MVADSICVVRRWGYCIPKNHISHEHPGAPWNWSGYGSSSSTSSSPYPLLSKTCLRLRAFISVLDLLMLKTWNLKELLMFSFGDRGRHCGGEWNINTSQVYVFLLDKHIVPRQLSTSKLLFPHFEHSEEKCRPQLHVPSPTRASRSIRLLFWMKCVIMRELWSMTNYFSYPYFLLSSIAIIFHPFCPVSHPNMTAGTRVFHVHQNSLYFSSSVSVSVLQTNRQSWMKKIIFCMSWNCLNALVLSV